MRLIIKNENSSEVRAKDSDTSAPSDRLFPIKNRQNYLDKSEKTRPYVKIDLTLKT